LEEFQEIGKKRKIISTFILTLRLLSPLLESGRVEEAWIKMHSIFKCLSKSRKKFEDQLN
jgi:hypothetical protein